MYLIDTDIVIYSLKNDEQVKARFRETDMRRKSIYHGCVRNSNSFA